MLCDIRLALELFVRDSASRQQGHQEYASTTPRYHAPSNVTSDIREDLPVRIKDTEDSSAFSEIGQRARVKRLLSL